jgi:hypothetical protein
MNVTNCHVLLQDWLLGQVEGPVLIQCFRDFCQSYSLPQKYQDALESVLTRIESSSLFTEESCSFSKKDLAHALNVWLEKSQQYHSKDSS